MYNKAHIPIYRIMDFCKSNIFVLNLKGQLLPKELSRSEEFDVWKAHLTDYYLFYYIQEGEFRIMVGTEQITLNGPALFYILPRQVKCLLSEENVAGWSLTIESSLVEERLIRLFEKPNFTSQPIKASAALTANLNNCFQLLYNLNNAKASLNVRLNLASACMEMIANAYLTINNDKQRSNQKETIHTERFFALLKEEDIKQKNLSDYASKLNLSTNYLNGCVKSTTGKSARYWIQHELILEAKGMLQYTDLSIKEIAHHLGFNSIAYFSRFFFKHAQMTATDFRNDIA